MSQDQFDSGENQFESGQTQFDSGQNQFDSTQINLSFPPVPGGDFTKPLQNPWKVAISELASGAPAHPGGRGGPPGGWRGDTSPPAYTSMFLGPKSSKTLGNEAIRRAERAGGNSWLA